jgi:hypothetical protein
VAGVPARPPTQDNHLLGTRRHFLHTRGRRSLPEGFAQSRNALDRFRPLRSRGFPGLYRDEYSSVLQREGGFEVGSCYSSDD